MKKEYFKCDLSEKEKKAALGVKDNEWYNFMKSEQLSSTYKSAHAIPNIAYSAHRKLILLSKKPFVQLFIVFSGCTAWLEKLYLYIPNKIHFK